MPPLYADHFQNYIESDIDENSINNCVNDINSDLKSASGWSDQNDLKINTIKTKAIIFHSGNVPSNLPQLILNNEVINIF